MSMNSWLSRRQIRNLNFNRNVYSMYGIQQTIRRPGLRAWDMYQDQGSQVLAKYPISQSTQKKYFLKFRYYHYTLLWVHYGVYAFLPSSDHCLVGWLTTYKQEWKPLYTFTLFPSDVRVYVGSLFRMNSFALLDSSPPPLPPTTDMLFIRDFLIQLDTRVDARHGRVNSLFGSITQTNAVN